jgi:hypothetical protein
MPAESMPMLLHAMHQFDDKYRQIEDMHRSRACRAYAGAQQFWAPRRTSY